MYKFYLFDIYSEEAHHQNRLETYGRTLTDKSMSWGSATELKFFWGEGAR